MPYTYEVECTEAIAREMARYEGSTLERLHFVRLGIINPITDEEEAKAMADRLSREPESTLVYRWRLVRHIPPERARWRSFGVIVWDT